MSYFSILLVVFLASVLLEFYFRIHLFHTVKERIIITLIFFVIGVVWDTYSTLQGHWIFPEKNLFILPENPGQAASIEATRLIEPSPPSGDEWPYS